MKNKTSLSKICLIATSTLLLAACAGAPKDPGQAERCKQGLASAYKELDLAQAQGFDGTVDWTKASSLLTAAKVQQQFGKYPNCIEKVGRAKYYIGQSKI